MKTQVIATINRTGQQGKTTLANIICPLNLTYETLNIDSNNSNTLNSGAPISGGNAKEIIKQLMLISRIKKPDLIFLDIGNADAKSFFATLENKLVRDNIHTYVIPTLAADGDAVIDVLDTASKLLSRGADLSQIKIVPNKVGRNQNAKPDIEKFNELFSEVKNTLGIKMDKKVFVSDEPSFEELRKRYNTNLHTFLNKNAEMPNIESEGWEYDKALGYYGNNYFAKIMNGDNEKEIERLGNLMALAETATTAYHKLINVRKYILN